jgi:hypothetical protein
MLFKLKTSQPKNILNIILNKNIITHTIILHKNILIINKKDFNKIHKIFKQNYLKYKLLN